MASIVNGMIEQIQPGNTPYAIASTAYGECTVNAETKAKTVEMTGFVLKQGVTIHIKFTNANTAASPTLNVNGTGAKPIIFNSDTAAGTNSETTGWYAGAVLSLTYDGANWVRDQGFNTNSSPTITLVTWTA